MKKRKRESQHNIYFDSFQLDTENEILWRGAERIHLRHKTYALLRHLVENSGRLVTKKELLSTLWTNCYVADNVLKQCVVEVRKALGDDVNTPRFIETVHGRGYRFNWKIRHMRSVNRGQGMSDKKKELNPHISDLQPVGRDEELALLQFWSEKALEGERQVVFVAGEQGVGKTTLVDSFLDILVRGLPTNSQISNSQTGASKFRACVARGQCIESHGASEAYMPILEAFTRLCREPMRPQVMSALNQHAPFWLTQMPSLVSADRLEALQRITLGATPARMLREMAEAIEALSADLPLVLVLEDLHWSDYSTLDLISYLAQRRAPARLLLVATFRQEEVMGDGHPLMGIKQELQIHRQCQELLLVPLDETSVREYLSRQFREHEFPVELGSWIYQRTDGNPLFMVNLIDHLAAQGFITKQDGSFILSAPLKAIDPGVPSTIQQMVKRQIERCSQEEQQLLKAGSVVGLEFCASAVAAALNEDVSKIEELCKGLVHRHRFLQLGSPCLFADGKQTLRYKLTHSLYHEICYKELPQARAELLHRRVGEYIEGGCINHIENLASKLATHFELARQYDRAIEYYKQAAVNANRQHIYCDAIELARRGLRSLEMAPHAVERTHQELNLQIALGVALMATQGSGSEEVERAFTRAQELCQQSGDMIILFSAVLGLWRCFSIRAEGKKTRELSEQLLQLAQNEQDPTMLNVAHNAMGITMMGEGEFAGALEHFENCIDFTSLQEKVSDRYLYGIDPCIVSRSMAALTKWELGYPNQALKYTNDALALADEMRDTESYVYAYLFAAYLHRRRRESKQVLERAEAALATARQQGLAHWIASGTGIYGWALAKQGYTKKGIEQIRQALEACQAIGLIYPRVSVLTMLAEVALDLGNVEEGLLAVEEALNVAQQIGLYNCEAEINLIKGELLFQESATRQILDQAEECYHCAIEVARKQQAKSYELRATMGLARLWQKNNRQTEAQQRLLEIYNWFIEGHDTVDLQEAHAQLQKLLGKSNVCQYHDRETFAYS